MPSTARAESVSSPRSRSSGSPALWNKVDWIAPIAVWTRVRASVSVSPARQGVAGGRNRRPAARTHSQPKCGFVVNVTTAGGRHMNGAYGS